MRGPFIVTYSDGTMHQYNETIERTKYLAALRTGLLGPFIVKIEPVEEWQRRRTKEELARKELTIASRHASM